MNGYGWTLTELRFICWEVDILFWASFSAVDEEVQVSAEFQGVAADSWCFLCCITMCTVVK